VVDVNHIGITVPDLDAAASWYCTTFGLRLVEGPEDASLRTPGASRRLDVFGDRWGAMRVVHLLADNGAGIELFEFLDPPYEPVEDTFAYWRAGVSHIAFTVDDIDRVSDEIVRTGGRTRSEVHHLHGHCRVRYCEDPWGTVVELSTGSYHESHPGPAATPAAGRPGPTSPR
jgi:catechol 2,3-dioxygenase-like lactoylglutathione lyase family enzyme